MQVLAQSLFLQVFCKSEIISKGKKLTENVLFWNSFKKQYLGLIHGGFQ